MPRQTQTHQPFAPSLPKGLTLASLTPDAQGKIVVSERPEYAYYAHYLGEGQTIEISHLACACAFLPDMEHSLRTLLVNGEPVGVEGAALVERQRFVIQAISGHGYVLVAGSRKASPLTTTPHLETRTPDQHYIVHKPWGQEYWINGEHPVYSFKGIHVREGAHTSLQYHRHKTEVAVLCKGRMELFYKANRAVANDETILDDLGMAQLRPLSSVAVEPATLHRVRGSTDIRYYELSTPFLDDVVRVHDDHNRGHGRIDSEHRRNGQSS